MAERYEIKGKLGQGGVGAVYRAFDTSLNREVAIKRLLPDEESEVEDASEEILKKEAAILSALQHPNIISIYDFDSDEDGAYVVMELVDGKTLEELVAEAPLTHAQFLDFAPQCMEGLVAAHQEGLLHRDIKPGNIMLRTLPTGKYQVKILDFGLAKFSVKPAVQTIDQSGAILGSIYFLAPEQFERIPLDGRTDIYALGCVFYYSLAGQYPFTGDDPPAVMMSHLNHTVEPLHSLRPDLPPALCDWVMQLIGRVPDDRPANTQLAYDKFRAIIEGTDPSNAAAPIPVTQPSGPLLVSPATTGTIPTIRTNTGNTSKTLVTGPVSSKHTSGIHSKAITTRSVELPGDPSQSTKKTWLVILLVCATIAASIAAFLHFADDSSKNGTHNPIPVPTEIPALDTLVVDLSAEAGPMVDAEKKKPASQGDTVMSWHDQAPVDGNNFFFLTRPNVDFKAPTLEMSAKNPDFDTTFPVIRFHTRGTGYAVFSKEKPDPGFLHKSFRTGEFTATIVARLNPNTKGDRFLMPLTENFRPTSYIEYRSGKLVFVSKVKNTQKKNPTTSADYDPGSWFIATCTRSATVSRFHLTIAGQSHVTAPPLKGNFPLEAFDLFRLTTFIGPTKVKNFKPETTFNGDIARILLHQKALTDSEIASLHAFLEAKYFK